MMRQTRTNGEQSTGVQSAESRTGKLAEAWPGACVLERAERASPLAFSQARPDNALSAPRCPGTEAHMLDFAQARRMMVDCQLRTFDVNDLAVLSAMDDVPRERFVPEGREAFAYIDKAIPVSDDADALERRAMLAPMVLARLIQALGLERG